MISATRMARASLTENKTLSGEKRQRGSKSLTTVGHDGTRETRDARHKERAASERRDKGTAGG